MQKLLEYCWNNLASALVVLWVMNKYGVKQLWSSTSVTVPSDKEVATGNTTNPQDTQSCSLNAPPGRLCRWSSFNVELLRYFINTQVTVDKLKKVCGLFICNLGTGKGCNVLILLHIYEKTHGKGIPHKIGPRRVGNVTICYSNVDKAWRELDWKG